MPDFPGRRADSRGHAQGRRHPQLPSRQKQSFDWKDTSFADVIEDINSQVKGLRLRPDTKSGVNLNKQITFKAKDLPLEDILD